jgi:hypothetical protein
MKQSKRPVNVEVDAGGNPACSSTKRQREEEEEGEEQESEEEGQDGDESDGEVTIDLSYLDALTPPERRRQKRLLKRNKYLLKMAIAAIKQKRNAMTEDQDESQDVSLNRGEVLK